MSAGHTHTRARTHVRTHNITQHNTTDTPHTHTCRVSHGHSWNQYQHNLTISYWYKIPLYFVTCSPLRSTHCGVFQPLRPRTSVEQDLWRHMALVGHNKRQAIACTNDDLTHWGRDKMAIILMTTFSNAFSWMKMYEFRLRFHWNLFLRGQFRIFQHWFR